MHTLPRTQTKLLDTVNRGVPLHEAITYGGATPFGQDEVHRYTLPNGLTLLLLVDRTAPVVHYATWFRVGSRHEVPGKTGIAHFFEHLMFGGTTTRKHGEFDRKLEEKGAESNAATWLDWTYYHESLPAKELPLAVALESDRMQNLVLQAPQVTSEIEVVANERRQRVEDDIDGAANELLYKTAFAHHTYHHPTIGWMEDIARYNPEDCQAFYKTYYAPNHATVVIVGDVRPQDVLRRIRDAYGPIPSSNIPPEDIHPEPFPQGARSVELRKPTASPRLMLGYRGPALGDADHIPLTVLNEILFGGRASRVYERLVKELEVASEVRGWVSTFAHPGLYEITLTLRPGQEIDRAAELLQEEFQRVCSDVVSPEEITRAVSRLELALVQSLETASGKAESIGFYETVLGDPGAAFRRLAAYTRVDASALRWVARRYLVEEGCTTVRVLPHAEEERNAS